MGAGTDPGQRGDETSRQMSAAAANSTVMMRSKAEEALPYVDVAAAGATAPEPKPRVSRALPEAKAKATSAKTKAWHPNARAWAYAAREGKTGGSVEKINQWPREWVTQAARSMRLDVGKATSKKAIARIIFEVAGAQQALGGPRAGSSHP